MDLIEWREEFYTGIAKADYDHEELIKLINTVYSLIDNEACRSTVIGCLGEIYANTSAHFRLEEQTMKRHGYDHYKAHRADHNRLLDKIIDISDEYEKTTCLNRQAFKSELNNWFQNHFKTHDSRLHKQTGTMSCNIIGESRLKLIISDARTSFYIQLESRKT